MGQGRIARGVSRRNDCLRAGWGGALALRWLAGSRGARLRAVDDVARIFRCERAGAIAVGGATRTVSTKASLTMATKIRGIEGMRQGELDFEIQRGAKFILFQYCISVIVLTFRRPSDIYF